MASPLSPAANGALNIGTPPTTKRSEQYEIHRYTTESQTPIIDYDDDASSPFISCIDKSTNNENMSPTKSQRSRVQSGEQLSPLKILSEQKSPGNTSSPGDDSTAALPLPRSPKKVSPVKRFPVKVSNPLEQDSRGLSNQGRRIDIDTAIETNAGLKHAIEIFEDEQSVMQEDKPPQDDDEKEDEAAGPDDTMVSTFSTFSAVPDMTMFAKLRSSPLKASQHESKPPRGWHDSASQKTPKPAPARDSGNTMNLLMDFTEQLRNPTRSPTKNPSQTVQATPDRRFGNLLDFDIPPMPTPRSVPSITPRELESLKSQFLSEISSLKASLSGKEAEVQSLKTAVGDAEKRVGETHEQLREEQLAKEQLAAEKEDWENRGREMESVLRKVKEDIVASETERQELEQKLEESEKRREAAEMLHQEAESKIAGMRAGRANDKHGSSPEKARSPDSSNKDVEIAVERVARELHGLYKSKHETKVSALKKSYESRWSKKVKELESKIDELNEDNERLKNGRDATLTKVEPGSAEADELKARAVKDSAAMTELKADIERLEAVVSTVQRDNVDLRGMLEKERVEKGELVQLAEEMMSMQGASFIGSSSEQAPAPTPSRQRQQAPARDPQPPHPEAPAAKTPKTSHEGFKGASATRASGLRAPGSSLRAPHERNKSAGGLPRPGAGMGRSGIMNSIEKMGSYRGRGGE